METDKPPYQLLFDFGYKSNLNFTLCLSVGITSVPSHCHHVCPSLDFIALLTRLSANFLNHFYLWFWYLKPFGQIMLIYFVRMSITVHQTSCLFGWLGFGSFVCIKISNRFVCFVEFKRVKQSAALQWFMELFSGRRWRLEYPQKW